MTGLGEGTGPTSVPPKEDPGSLALRGKPRPVVRFRRGLIVGIAAALAALVAGATWFAFEPPAVRGAAGVEDSLEPGSRSADEALAKAPKNYGDVPRLGPPLPGDLGRPILEHQRRVGEEDGLQPGGISEPDANTAGDADRQRVHSELRSALSSAVMVGLQSPSSTSAVGEGGERPREEAADPEPIDLPSSASQQRKIAFARSGDRETGAQGLRAPSSPWTLGAGTIIPASLVTGLNSDLPGIVIAQVTENVCDSATGKTVLVPHGARLIGSYDNLIAYGQQRALLVWKRIVFPDGSSIALDNMPAADASGYSGLADKVDSHSWRLIKGIVLSSLLGVGTELSLGRESGLVRALREAAQQNAAHAGDQITARNLEVQPTVTIRPGWPVLAIVNQDLVLQPGRG